MDDNRTISNDGAQSGPSPQSGHEQTPQDKEQHVVETDAQGFREMERPETGKIRGNNQQLIAPIEQIETQITNKMAGNELAHAGGALEGMVDQHNEDNDFNFIEFNEEHRIEVRAAKEGSFGPQTTAQDSNDLGRKNLKHGGNNSLASKGSQGSSGQSGESMTQNDDSGQSGCQCSQPQETQRDTYKSDITPEQDSQTEGGMEIGVEENEAAGTSINGDGGDSGIQSRTSAKDANKEHRNSLDARPRQLDGLQSEQYSEQKIHLAAKEMSFGVGRLQQTRSEVINPEPRVSEVLSHQSSQITDTQIAQTQGRESARFDENFEGYSRATLAASGSFHKKKSSKYRKKTNAMEDSQAYQGSAFGCCTGMRFTGKQRAATKPKAEAPIESPMLSQFKREQHQLLESDDTYKGLQRGQTMTEASSTHNIFNILPQKKNERRKSRQNNSKDKDSCLLKDKYNCHELWQKQMLDNLIEKTMRNSIIPEEFSAAENESGYKSQSTLQNLNVENQQDDIANSENPFQPAATQDNDFQSPLFAHSNSVTFPGNKDQLFSALALQKQDNSMQNQTVDDSLEQVNCPGGQLDFQRNSDQLKEVTFFRLREPSHSGSFNVEISTPTELNRVPMENGFIPGNNDPKIYDEQGQKYIEQKKNSIEFTKDVQAVGNANGENGFIDKKIKEKNDLFELLKHSEGSVVESEAFSSHGDAESTNTKVEGSKNSYMNSNAANNKSAVIMPYNMQRATSEQRPISGFIPKSSSEITPAPNKDAIKMLTKFENNAMRKRSSIQNIVIKSQIMKAQGLNEDVRYVDDSQGTNQEVDEMINRNNENDRNGKPQSDSCSSEDQSQVFSKNSTSQGEFVNRLQAQGQQHGRISKLDWFQKESQESVQDLSADGAYSNCQNEQDVSIPGSSDQHNIAFSNDKFKNSSQQMQSKNCNKSSEPFVSEQSFELRMSHDMNMDLINAKLINGKQIPVRSSQIERTTSLFNTMNNPMTHEFNQQEEWAGNSEGNSFHQAGTKRSSKRHGAHHRQNNNASQDSIQLRVPKSKIAEFDMGSSDNIDQSKITLTNQSHQRKASMVSEITDREIKIEDFKKIKKLGQGSYGKVYLASYNDKQYSIKKLARDFLIKRQKVESVFRERDILINGKNCPFLPRLYHSFADDEYVYLVMEYIPNGTLEEFIKKHCNYGFPREVVQFYAAQMILTLEYLQEKNVAHRDLKPANVMIGHNNYLKLIDFGEAKIVDNFEDNARNSNDQNTGDRRQSLSAKSDGTSAFFYKVLRKDKNQKNRKKQGTFVGTQMYQAPEMVSKSQSGLYTDLWALGCIIFEMTCGQKMFGGKNVQEVMDKILDRDFTYPENPRMNDTVKSLIDQLTGMKPHSRIGLKDIQAIKNHPYFAGFNFESVAQQIIPRPPLDTLPSASPAHSSPPSSSPQIAPSIPAEIPDYQLDMSKMMPGHQTSATPIMYKDPMSVDIPDVDKQYSQSHQIDHDPRGESQGEQDKQTQPFDQDADRHSQQQMQLSMLNHAFMGKTINQSISGISQSNHQIALIKQIRDQAEQKEEEDISRIHIIQDAFKTNVIKKGLIKRKRGIVFKSYKEYEMFLLQNGMLLFYRNNVDSKHYGQEKKSLRMQLDETLQISRVEAVAPSKPKKARSKSNKRKNSKADKNTSNNQDNQNSQSIIKPHKMSISARGSGRGSSLVPEEVVPVNETAPEAERFSIRIGNTQSYFESYTADQWPSAFTNFNFR